MHIYYVVNVTQLVSSSSHLQNGSTTALHVLFRLKNKMRWREECLRARYGPTKQGATYVHEYVHMRDALVHGEGEGRLYALPKQ